MAKVVESRVFGQSTLTPLRFPVIQGMRRRPVSFRMRVLDACWSAGFAACSFGLFPETRNSNEYHRDFNFKACQL